MRLQPFPLVFKVEELSAEQDYVVCILDDHSGDLSETSVTSDANGKIEFDLPNFYSRYDDEYRVEIYVKDGEEEDGRAIRGDLVYVDTLTIMRPYVDPRTLAQSENDLIEAEQYEGIARAIINAITGGFMYQRQTVETVGLGNDYLALPFRLNKIIRVYENDVLVYDANPADPETWTNINEYYITPDKAAISIVMPTGTGYQGFNRMQSKSVTPPQPASDSFTLYNTNDSPNIIQTKIGSPMFPSGWDYVVEVEVGWPIIPHDIRQATSLLINDLKCNNIPYMNAYIREYESDQFNLKFERDIFLSDKTGNRIVDRILSAYVRPIYRLGVL